MQETLKKIAPWVLFAAALAWLCWYLSCHRDSLVRLLQIRVSMLIPLLAVSLADMFLQGWLFKLTMEGFGVRLSFKEWFGLKAAQFLGNLVAPFGGFGLRMAYLKGVHRMPHSENLLAAAALVMIEFQVFSAGGMLALWLCGALESKEGLLIGAMLLAAFAASCAAMLMPGFKAPGGMPGSKLANRLLESWSRIRQDKALVFKIYLFTILEIAIVSMAFIFAFKALKHHTPAALALLVASLADFSLYFRVTPGALGTYEAAVSAPLSLAGGMDAADGIVVAELVRAAGLVFHISIGGAAIWMLGGRLAGRRQADIERSGCAIGDA